MTTFETTAYGPPWGGIEGGGNTASGIPLPKSNTNQIIPIVAADPRVLPIGSKIRAWPNPYNDRNMIFTVADVGGAIKGNKLDFLVLKSRAAQNAWGRRNVNVSVLSHGNGKATMQTVGTNNGLKGVTGKGTGQLDTSAGSIVRDNSGNILGGAIPDALGAATGLTGVEAIGNFFNLISDPGARKYAGMVIVGVIALGIGTIYVARSVAAPAIGAVTNVTPIGKASTVASKVATSAGTKVAGTTLR